MGKYLGCIVYELFALTYHVPVQQYYRFSLIYSRGEAQCWRGGACCLPVETTILICSGDQKLDERFFVHRSSYVVGCFRRHYGNQSRGSFFTYHHQVMTDTQQ